MRSALIVSGGGFQGLGLLDSLRQLPAVRPIVADMHADNITRYLCSDYFTVPPVSDRAGFRSALIDLTRREGVDTIFPATAYELPLLAELAHELRAEGAFVAVSSSALIRTLLDKILTAQLLRDRHLPAQMPVEPEFHDFRSGLFGKPRAGWGGKGTAVARTLLDVRRHQSTNPRESMAWFPLIDDFEEFSADFTITPLAQLSRIVMRRRLRVSGGFAVISESEESSEILRTAETVAEVLIDSGGCGIFNVQFIRTSDGKIFISDVNPRFGTSAVHGLAEGINLPGFFMDAPGLDQLPATSRRRSVKSVRYLKTIAIPKLSTQPRGLVFDLDDTLVDHKLWMAAKVESAYLASARDWTDANDFMFHALLLIDEGERSYLIDRLADRFSWSAAQRDVFLAAYRRARIEPTPLFSDVAPTLTALKRSGFELAILTDNPPETQRTKIENAAGFEIFSAIVYARETGGEKPSRNAFCAAATALAIEPDDLWMIGDNYFRDGLGAVRNGYAGAVIVSRPGTLVRPHDGLAIKARTASCNIHRVENLYCLREIFLAA